jgi:hypothetical protein
MFFKIRTTKTVGGFLAAAVLSFSPLFLVRAHAQVVGATLSGTVTDQSGAVLPQASVSVKNVATDITRASAASAAGFYTVPNLLPGVYDVTVTAKGFSTEIKTGVNLTVGEQQVLDFTLQVGRQAKLSWSPPKLPTWNWPARVSVRP